MDRHLLQQFADEARDTSLDKVMLLVDIGLVSPPSVKGSRESSYSTMLMDVVTRRRVPR